MNGGFDRRIRNQIGEIKLVSEVGKGAAFRIEFPLCSEAKKSQASGLVG